MAGAPECIYSAKRQVDILEEHSRVVIEGAVVALVRVKELQSDLRDCEDFEEGPDEQLQSTCEELLFALVDLKEFVATLEEKSKELFDSLGFTPEWSEKLKRWFMAGEIYERYSSTED